VQSTYFKTGSGLAFRRKHLV